MFWWRIKKNSMWILPLIWSYAIVGRLFFLPTIKVDIINVWTPNKLTPYSVQAYLGLPYLCYWKHCLYVFVNTVLTLLMCLKCCCMCGKQCIAWSDAAFCSVWSWSTLFAKACLSQYLGLLQELAFFFLLDYTEIYFDALSCIRDVCYMFLEVHDLLFMSPVAIALCLLVCWLDNINISHNFWTIWDRAFIFGM